jgi:hypothetical protein
LPGGRRTLWVTKKGFRLHPSSFPGLTLTQVGHTLAGSSSSRRISRPMRGAATRRRQSRRSRSKQSSASTSCSISNAVSMATALPSSRRTVPLASRRSSSSTAGTDAWQPAATCFGRLPFGLRWSPGRHGWTSSVRGAAPAGRSTCERSTGTRWPRLARCCLARSAPGVRARRRCRSCSACTLCRQTIASASLYEDLQPAESTHSDRP